MKPSGLFGFTVLCFALLSFTMCANNLPTAEKKAEKKDTMAKNKKISVTQSGGDDIVGNDSHTLNEAAALLSPGDTLEIGPGVWKMDNSLFIRVPNVTVTGVPGKTILKKNPGISSVLVDDGDYGESILRVAEPEKFKPGMGITIKDNVLNQGWNVSVTTVTAVRGDTLFIEPMTVRDYSIEPNDAFVQNTFPILAAFEVSGVTFRGITVDGSKDDNNGLIDGCRGGAIYFYKVENSLIDNCVANNYNGDGISFQITDNVKVTNCESYGNTGLGIHPGTGSPNAEVSNCKSHDNDDIGLFLCWRVRYGKFTGNEFYRNGNYGISIGHKDTDNLFTDNLIYENGVAGVIFREETYKNSGHRCTLRNNEIRDNGNSKEGYGVLLEPNVEDIVLENNKILDSRDAGKRTQRYGVYKQKNTGKLTLSDNEMSGNTVADFYDEAK